MTLADSDSPGQQPPRPLSTREDLVQWIDGNLGRLRTIIAIRCRVKDANFIDDVMQDIRIAAMHEIDRPRPIEHPGALFLTVLIPQAVRKSEMKAAGWREREQKKARETPELCAETPLASTERRELVSAVRAAIESMSKWDKIMAGILRGLYDGKNQTQIAHELGIPKQTVYSRLKRSIEPQLSHLLKSFLKQ